MHQNFINGRSIDSSKFDSIAVFDPSTGKEISRVPDSSKETVDEAVAAAKAAQPAWAKLPAQERAVYLRKIAAAIRAKNEEIAHTIVQEQGKVLGLARVEVSFTADYLDYMAEWARRIEGEIITSDRANENIFLFRQPIGVIGGILPWNFPFFLIARKLAPALVTGNTIVIKPSEETPNNAVSFVEIMRECELPAGVANFVYGRGATTGTALAGHRDIGMISFTGSVDTGAKVMMAAAQNITKVNLELGGKAPAIVLDDADIDLAVGAIKASRVINSGQVCNCAERVYVHHKVANEFVDKLSSEMNKTKFGNPLGGSQVDMGPLINAAALKKVGGLVDRAVKDGAQIVSGGKAVEREGGNYFEPTVLINCRHESEIMQKEIFGPVAPIHVVGDIDEAIRKANDSIYGLTSSIYTRDINKAMRACNEINFGETYINRENFEAMQGFHAGCRSSGIGGADGKHGLYEYTQSHVVYLQHRP